MQERAVDYFAGGYNCCQSILLAANDIWKLEISEDLIAAGTFFREGMASGCTCGALVGLEMVLGIVQKRKKDLALKANIAKELHQSFINAFGSSCCRALRKKQSILERATHQGCRRITAGAAGILYDFMAELKAF